MATNGEGFKVEISKKSWLSFYVTSQSLNHTQTSFGRKKKKFLFYQNRGRCGHVVSHDTYFHIVSHGRYVHVMGVTKTQLKKIFNFVVLNEFLPLMHCELLYNKILKVYNVRLLRFQKQDFFCFKLQDFFCFNFRKHEIILL